MGKDRKGKELGQGLSQRKDGSYTARFVTKTGYRKQKYFDTLAKARVWLQEAKHEDKCSTVPSFDMMADNIIQGDAVLTTFDDMTVDEWFRFWLENIVPDLRSNTRRNYRDRYTINIRPVIGKLKMKDVRPLHCKKVLLDMESDYAGSTIRQTYVTMGTMFKSALMNGVIIKHPMDGVKYAKPCKSASDIKAFTLDEQDKFIKQARWSHNYDQYSLILETGLRTGEMIGLTWDSVDLCKR